MAHALTTRGFPNISKQYGAHIVLLYSCRLQHWITLSL